MTRLFKTMLFISSYFPLYLLIIVNILPFENLNITSFSPDRLETIVYVVLVMLSLVSFIPVIYIRKCELNDTINSKKVNKKHGETLSYLVTYIIPLLIIDISDPGTLITNIILFMLIGFLYVKSNMIHINILFLLFGWNIYEDSDDRIIITKEKPDYFLRLERSGGNLTVKNFGSNIFLHRKR